MADTYTGKNGIIVPEIGANVDSWGDDLNTNFALIDDALDGQTVVTMAAGTTTLAATDGADSAGRARVLDLGGTTGTLSHSANEKWYIVRNGGTGVATFNAGSGNTFAVAPGRSEILVYDGFQAYPWSVHGNHEWTLIQRNTTTSGTTSDFEPASLSRWKELSLVFEGTGHSTAGAVDMRMGFGASAGSYSNQLTIGSFAGSATVYGEAQFRWATGASAMVPAAIMASVAVASLTTSLAGGAAGSNYPFRLDANPVGIRVDFSGATFDSGAIALYGR